MKHVTPVLILVVALLADLPRSRADENHAKDRAALLAGVSEIAAPGVPGPLVVLDDNAFVVVAGTADRGILAPVVAAGKSGAGRVVVFGHTGYADSETLAKADTQTLVLNALNWVPQHKDSKRPRVGVFSAALGSAMKTPAYDVVTLPEGDWITRLDSLDALYMSQRSLSDTEIDAIRKFIRAGGGMVACGLGWGWLQLNPGKSLDLHPLNRVLDGSGIYIADGALDRTGRIGFACGQPLSPYLHALTSIEAITSGDKTPIANDAMRQASWTASSAIRAIPTNDTMLRPKLQRLLKDRNDDLIPTEKKPITSADGVARLLLTMQIEELRKIRPGRRIQAHPAAREFPGEVPKDALEISRIVEIDCSVPGWHGTGLYAPAGRPIRIDVPTMAKNADLRVRIGAHTDELWNKDKWSRVPEITLEAPLYKKITTIGSPFGGPVYIVVPKNCKKGTIEIKINGAVEMPHFILGTTTVTEWKTRIRSLPAPWGELETSKVILTLPSRVLRDLDDPETLMKFWDRILDAHATLATIPLQRERPERMVADVQISAGYMHSGYPIMTHLDVDRAFVDVDVLGRGEKIWGFVHELGHNHQSSDWTFDGTGEVTCNLFSLHAIDTVCKSPPGKRGHDAVDKPPDVAAYMKRGAKFDEWKRDPFLALQMYVQLQKEFGWETFKRVFAEYRGLSKGERPRNDAEKRDQWLVRFSRACGHNLGPFFTAWGVPTSNAAKESIADLPEWMPAGFPK